MPYIKSFTCDKLIGIVKMGVFRGPVLDFLINFVQIRVSRLSHL